jgi:uncharacterized protein (TIGR02588 family)
MSPKKQKNSSLPSSAAEWFSLSVSLLILATVVGLIVWLWVRETPGAPRFLIERGAVASEAGVFHLPVAVTNVGGTAAGQVEVEGRLGGGVSEETPKTVIDFMPVRARKEVVLTFRGDPTGASVEVVSYQRP